METVSGKGNLMKGRKYRGQHKTAARSTVKSEVRVLRLLEYFSRINREVTVMDVARNLGFPQSSTSELLHRLAEQGYLAHDLRRRVYQPTARIALIGAQLIPQMFGNCQVLEMIDELCKLTTAPVFLNGRSASTVQVIHLTRHPGEATPVEDTGLKYPIVTATPGRLLLSMAPENQVRGLVRRHNADMTSAKARIDLQKYLNELAHIRSCGYALSRSEEHVPLPVNPDIAPRRECYFKDDGRLSLPLTGPVGEQLAITLKFPSNAAISEQQDYIQTMIHTVERFTGEDEREISYHFLDRSVDDRATLRVVTEEVSAFAAH